MKYIDYITIIFIRSSEDGNAWIGKAKEIKLREAAEREKESVGINSKTYFDSNLKDIYFFFSYTKI